MRDLSSVDFHCIVRELADAIIGARIDKLYAPEPHRIVLQLRKGGVGRSILIIQAPKAAFLSSTKEEMPEKPSNWCVRLRNLLEGMKITAVSQPQSERCLKLSCAKQDASYDIYAEFFGKGNIIVTDAQGIAQAVLFEREFKDRVVANNKPYVPPSGPDIFAKGVADFVALVTQPFKGSAQAMLATKAALGQIYAKELCARAGIDPETAIIDAAQAEKLFDALHALIESPLAPAIVDGEPSPLHLTSRVGTAQSFPSFSAAIEKALESAHAPIETKATNVIDEQAERLRKSIGQQQAAADKLEAEAQVLQRVGESIYERYQDVEILLKGVAEARKKGTMDAFLKSHPEIKEYKQASGDIIVEF